MKNFDNFNYKSDAAAKFKEIYGKEEEFKEISLSSITVLPQVRTEFNSEAISELAESIKKIGVIQPVVVISAAKGYRLVIGERRYRASKLAGKDTIPARIFKNLSEQEITVLQLIENIHREDLSDLELAGTYKKLHDGGLSTRDIADMVRKSQPHVVKTLSLLNLDDELKDAVKRGLSPEKAMEISKLPKDIRKNINPENVKRDELRKVRKNREGESQTIKAGQERETEDIESPKPIKHAGGLPDYKQMRDLMPGEATRAVIDDFYGKTPNMENQKPEDLDDLTEVPESIAGIDEFIEKFNSKLKIKNIRIAKESSSSIIIWAEEEQTLKNIIGSLGVIFRRNNAERGSKS